MPGSSRATPAKPKPVVCLFCGKKISPARHKALGRGPVRVGSYFCSNKCEKELAAKLGLDLDEETLEVIARGAPAEVLIYFGLKAGKLVWDAYRRRKAASAEPGPGPAPGAAPDPDASPPPDQREVELKALLADLGLPIGASLDECERAYKKLARERHPDMPGGSEAAMKKLNSCISRIRELMA